MSSLSGIWLNAMGIRPRSYKCGYCGDSTGTNFGFQTDNDYGFIYLCGGCNRPTFFQGRDQTPAPIMGNMVLHLPVDIEDLYNQARKCTQAQAFTACVLVCRKILMHVAVEKQAPLDLKFIQYVEYLADNGYIPPDSKPWVDKIRLRGNEAIHEIVLMAVEDALDLLSFVEMLLRIIYEFPAKLLPAKA